METINVALHTPLEGFANEYCDVLKLFYAVEMFRVNLHLHLPGGNGAPRGCAAPGRGVCR